MGYKTFPILTVARRSGLPVEDRGLRQVHINCPFCGDRRRRLYLYTDTNQYHCFHCPQPAVQRPPEREPAPLAQRDAVYRAMLGLLPLSAAHRDNLLTRGLTDEAIRQNSYRTLGDGKELRDRIAAQLSARFDLNGIPAFYSQSAWRMCAYSGLLVPVRAADGRIQGVQIRRDNADRMKYAWMSSAGKPYGTGARSWIHVAGDRNKKQAVITEGAIKGDVAVKKAGIPCRMMAWDPAYKGIDDFLVRKRSA